MTQPNVLICDIAELSKPNNSLFKQAKKHNSQDFVLVGDGVDTRSGTMASYAVVISETIPEDAARDILSDYWLKIPGKFKIFAWIPLNNIKEMVVCNLEKNTEMRLQCLFSMLKLTGADKYLQNNTNIDDVKQLAEMVK